MVTFEEYKFSATGAPTPRTMPDRLAETKNVRDFGATGNGSTDDLAAIMAAFNWTTANGRGTLYFPPGRYRVSAPINISGPMGAHLIGDGAVSTIFGDFPDYVIKRGLLGTSSGQDGGHLIERLKIINTHSTGGGIRFGNCVGGAIRNCDITANQGINTSQDDSNSSGAYWGSMEMSIENCHLRPGASAYRSNGIMHFADGPVNNCTMIGFDVGAKTWGGQGAQTFQGCYFERNKIGLLPGVSPSGGPSSARNFLVSGCRFRDNGVAIQNCGSYARYTGLLIEASEGTIPGNPQYGIRIDGGTAGRVLFSGILVTGQYQIAGIYIEGYESYHAQNSFIGVRSVNSSTLGGVAWHLPPTAHTADFIACNVTPVFTVSQLPAKTTKISSATWSGGFATVTLTGWHGLSPGKKAGNITVRGVSPSGYNGVFERADVVGSNQFVYPVADPGSAGSGGTVTAAGVNPSTGMPNVQQGCCYDVRDSNTANWGEVPISGGSHHVKVRWNGANWTVMGK